VVAFVILYMPRKKKRHDSTWRDECQRSPRLGWVRIKLRSTCSTLKTTKLRGLPQFRLCVSLNHHGVKV
jgi:hypothetical protein